MARRVQNPRLTVLGDRSLLALANQAAGDSTDPLPQGIPPQTPQQLVDGLGLDGSQAAALVERVGRWMQSRNAVELGRALMTDLHGLFPTAADGPRRVEIRRRAVQLWERTRSQYRNHEQMVETRPAATEAEPMSKARMTVRGDQLHKGMPGGGGWEAIPKGKRGGYRRRLSGGGWEYNYTDGKGKGPAKQDPANGKRPNLTVVPGGKGRAASASTASKPRARGDTKGPPAQAWEKKDGGYTIPGRDVTISRDPKKKGKWLLTVDGKKHPVGSTLTAAEKLLEQIDAKATPKDGKQKATKAAKGQADKGMAAGADKGAESVGQAPHEQLKALMAKVIAEHGVEAVQAAAMEATKAVARHADDEMKTAAFALAGERSIQRVVKTTLAKLPSKPTRADAEKVAEAIKNDGEARHAAERKLREIIPGIIDKSVDEVVRAGAGVDGAEQSGGGPAGQAGAGASGAGAGGAGGAAAGQQPGRARAIARAILKGAAGSFVFGFLDNFVLYLAGAGIDKSIAAMGFSAAAVAGLGNAVSDAVGQAGSSLVDKGLERIGLGEDETSGVLSEKTEKRIQGVAKIAGVFTGALAGMMPLLFGITFGKSEEDGGTLEDVSGDALPTYWYGSTLECVLLKGAGHKYALRKPNPSPPPRWRYIYQIPKRKGLIGDDQLHAGTKFKGMHAGTEGHFEVEHHDKAKGLVRVTHDESGRVAHIKEADLHRMVTAYHARRGAGAVKGTGQGGPPLSLKRPAVQSEMRTPKEAPAKQPAKKIESIGMADLGGGGWENIVGFAADEAAADEMAARMGGDGVEYAKVSQPGGYVVASRKQVSRSRSGEVRGSTTKVFLRDKSGRGISELDAEYVVMESNKVVPSHDPTLGFKVRDDYPADVQERRYHELPGEQLKVKRIAQTLEPQLVANTNPDGVNGTPIVTESGAVLGGNGRAMGMQLAYQSEPESAAKLKGYLEANAKQFGLSPSEVRNMKQPILVRRVKAGSDAGQLRKLGRRMNESLTQGLDPRTAEVALGKNFVTPELTNVLVDQMDANQSLSDYLGSSRSRAFVGALERAGIIDDLNRDEFVDKDTALLNEDGRLRVERVLAARFLPDATLLGKMGQSLRQNIAKSTPYLLRAEAAGWDLRAPLMAAVRADLDLRSRDIERELYLKQTVNPKLDPTNPLIAIQKDPMAALLMEVISQHNGARMMPAGFRSFARRAEASKHNQGGFSMFAEATESPTSALDRSFGVSPEVKRELRAAATAAKADEAATLARFGLTAPTGESKPDKHDPEPQPDTQTQSLFRSLDAVRGFAPEAGQLSDLMRKGFVPDPYEAIEHNCQRAWDDLLKSETRIDDAKLPAYLMDALVRELHHIVGSRANVQSLRSEGLHVGGEKVRKRLADWLQWEITHDAMMARALGTSKLSRDTINGLIEATVEVHAGELHKAEAEVDLDELLRKSYPVGTIRQWRGGNFRKVAPGKWVAVSESAGPRGLSLPRRPITASPAPVGKELSTDVKRSTSGKPDAPRQPNVKSWEDLYHHAKVADVQLKSFSRTVAADTDGRAVWPPADEHGSTLKGRERAEEKIEHTLTPEGNPDVTALTDISRASLRYEKIGEVYAALDRIRKDKSVEIVRFTDRFQKPIPGGYRDINLLLRMGNGHIAELQLHIGEIMDIKYKHGHILYEGLRVIEEKAEGENRVYTRMEAHKVAKLVTMSEHLYGDAWQKAVK